METFPEQFQNALERINDRRQPHAQRAHEEVRGALESSGRLKAWGIDTVLIGSYARRTSIYPGKDVDVFSKLTRLDTTVSPRGVFDEFVRVLTTEYGPRAKPQNRSVKIEFHIQENGERFSVDAVPAVRFGSRWGIPIRDQTVWGEDRSWVETDPEELTKRTAEKNKAPVLSGQGMYVPTVKLVRQIRQHHLEDAKPGGLYFELLTYWAFDRGLRNTGSYAELLAEVLAFVAQRLEVAHADPPIDPVLGRPFEPRPTQAEVLLAAAKLAELASAAKAALSEEQCPAAAAWRRILGQNPRGWCFTPLPEGCDEEGRKVGPVVSVISRGSKEAGSFGAS